MTFAAAFVTFDSLLTSEFGILADFIGIWLGIGAFNVIILAGCLSMSVLGVVMVKGGVGMGTWTEVDCQI